MTGARHTIEYVNFNSASDGSFQTARVGGGEGPHEITAISQNEPRGPGDCWFYDIVRKDGSFVRVFNPCQVGYSKPMNISPVKSKLIT